MQKVNYRLLAIATLFKKAEKQVLTNDIKEAVRKNDYKSTPYTSDYGIFKPKKKTFTTYTDKDGTTIQLDTNSIIKEYCNTHNITETKTEVQNYSIEFIPSPKAQKKFNKMLQELVNSNDKDIAETAKDLLNVINK